MAPSGTPSRPDLARAPKPGGLTSRHDSMPIRTRQCSSGRIIAAMNTNPRVIGNHRVLHGLDRAVAGGQVRHAYLLHGPGGVGKTTIARWLAARLRCEGVDPPCGACAACRRIERGIDPDVRLLHAGSDRESGIGLPFDPPRGSGKTAERSIGVDQIKELQHDASLAPRDGRWKVYLVAGAETMSLDAANRLLKTLEEPPASVVLILTTVDPDDLLSTVVSRCQSLRLSVVPSREIAAALRERFELASERADLLARLSAGRPGWAIQAASDPGFLDDRDAALADLDAVHGRSVRERLGVAERMASSYSKEPAAVFRILGTWQSWWWDVVLTQRGLRDQRINVDREAAIDRAAGSVPAPMVHAYLKRLNESSQWLVQNVNPRLALEATVLAAPNAR